MSPYINEHSCRLRDPGQYDRFNRKNCEQKHDGKCIDVIYGIKEEDSARVLEMMAEIEKLETEALRENRPLTEEEERKIETMNGEMRAKSEIQALRYPKDVWDADDARAHCKGRDGTFEPATNTKSQNPVHEERGAIAKHKTATSDAAWDGPANEARLKLDQDESYYRKAYAWQDPDGDPTKKNSYKFIHHEVGGEGNIGAANIKACQTTIAILNGARGGADIPAADRKGVWSHAAGHIKDADLEPAELKQMPDNLEKRSFPIEELRVTQDDDPPKITGYPAVFNKLSGPLFFGIREKIAPGAFKSALKNSDTRSLLNHDPNIVLGRKSAGTLKLKEDDHGLFMDITPPRTQLVNDMVLVPMKRGDIKEASFAFTVKREQWEEDKEKKTTTRTILEVEYLYDVSPVTFPAYPDTSVALRSYERWREENGKSSGATPGDPNPEPGVTPEGWEKVKSADADKAIENLRNLNARLIKVEVSKI